MPAPVHVGTDTKGKSAYASGGAVTPVTWSHTVPSGSDRALYVFVAISSVTGPQTVTYGGVALTNLGVTVVGPRMEIWRLLNPTVGTATVSITPFSTTRVCMGFAASYTGVHQTTPEGTFASATGTSTAPSVNVSSGTDELVIGCVHQFQASETLTAGAGQTSLGEDTANDTVVFTHAGASQEAGAGTVTFSYSASASDDWTIGGISLKPSVTLTLDNCLPDADVVTTGWSTAPLFSKVNDASDATVIQATAV